MYNIQKIGFILTGCLWFMSCLVWVAYRSRSELQLSVVNGLVRVVWASEFVGGPFPYAEFSNPPYGVSVSWCDEVWQAVSRSSRPHSDVGRYQVILRWLGLVLPRVALVRIYQDRVSNMRVRMFKTRLPIPMAACVCEVPIWTMALLIGSGPIWRAGLRARRRRRACCEQCGYDLRASASRCPECGTPIPREIGALLGDNIDSAPS